MTSKWKGISVPRLEKGSSELNTSGTSLVGYLDATFANLVDTFGPPNAEADEYKTDVEWHIMTPFGVATIYNYKDGKAYLGADGKLAKDIKDWHVGGHNKETYHFISELLVA